MSFPPTLFMIADKFGVLPGIHFRDRPKAEAHVAGVDPLLQPNMEIGEYRLVTPKLEPDLAFCEGEERG